MRCRIAVVILIVMLACSLISCAGAVTMAVNASPVQAHVGDTIVISGSIADIKTIAVFLFVTGPGLNNRSVTLENLNIPAGRGLFTTAPVNLKDGSWEYVWDTAVILGTLEPGKYTVYAVSTPDDRRWFTKGEFATAEIEFLPRNAPTNAVPLPLAVPLMALLIVAGAMVAGKRRIT